MNIYTITEKYAKALVEIIGKQEHGQVSYLNPVHIEFTRAIKGRYGDVLRYPISPKSVETNTVVYVPVLTPMVPIFNIMNGLMENPVVFSIYAAVPWQFITNAACRTRNVMNWGLSDIYHLPRNSYPKTSVQACFVEMHKLNAGQPAQFHFLEV